MTFQSRIKDAQWLQAKSHPVSLFLTAKALGQGSGEAWQKFKTEHAGKSNYDLCVLQGITPEVSPSTVDNRKLVKAKAVLQPEYASFITVVRKEFGSFKREIKGYVRSEITKQLNAR